MIREPNTDPIPAPVIETDVPPFTIVIRTFHARYKDCVWRNVTTDGINWDQKANNMRKAIIRQNRPIASDRAKPRIA